MVEPFFWEKRGAWFLNVTKPDGSRGRIKLHQNKKKAFEIWKALDDPLSVSNPLLASVANDWVGFLRQQAIVGAITSDHAENAAHAVTQFLNENPRLRWSAFTKEAVTQFCGQMDWKADTIRKRMGLLRQLSSYGLDEKGLPDNLRKIKKPSSSPRQKWITKDEYLALIQAVMRGNRPGQCFALFLAALYHTGARPGELANALIGDFKGDYIELVEWKNRSKTGKTRRIFLECRSRVAVNLAIADRTDKKAPIFLDSKGRQLHKDSIRNRINRLCKLNDLDPEIVSYSFRHAYAHRALKSKVEVSTLAVLMGTSVGQIEKTYGHLNEATDLLANAAASVR